MVEHEPNVISPQTGGNDGAITNAHDKSVQNVPDASSGKVGQTVVTAAAASTQQSHDNFLDLEGAITWEASEFVHHEKDATWYVGFALITLAAACGVFLLRQNDYWAGFLVLLTGVAFMFISKKPPNMTKYAVGDNGLSIGGKQYTYEQFKSFTLVSDADLIRVLFAPVNRFMPPVSLYVNEQNADGVIDIIADYLPHDESDESIFDQALARLKF